MRAKLKKFSSSKLVRNTAWMLVGHGFRVGLQAGYFVLSARTLGVAGLGVFSGALALAKILLPFAGWGSDELMVLRAARNPADFAKGFGNALLVLSASGSVLTLAALLLNDVVFAARVPWMVVLLVVGGELLFYRAQLVVRRAFQAFDLLRVTAFFKAAPSLTLIIAVVAFRFTSEGHDVVAFAWWYFAAMAVPGAGGIAYTIAILGRPTFAPKETLRQMADGFFFSLSESARTTYTDADKILLLRLGSEQSAGIYKSAHRILSVAMMPVLALLDAAYARFYKTGEAGVKGSYRFALSLMPVSVAYASVVAVGMYLAAPIMPFILGPGYAESSEVLRWLAPIPILQSISYLLMQSLTGGGSQRARGIGQLFIAVLSVAGNFLWIATYSWRASAVMAFVAEALLAVMMFVLCRRAARASA